MDNRSIGIQKHKFRGPEAHMSIELSVIALLVVFTALASFDIAIAAWGFSLADLAARDALRAACSTSTATAGLRAAQFTCLTHPGDGYWVTTPALAGGAVYTDQYGNSSAEDFTYQPNPAQEPLPPQGNGPAGAPWVQVTARCNILLPFKLGYFGTQSNGSKICYSRTYSGPILGVAYRPVSSIALGSAPPSFSVPPSTGSPPSTASPSEPQQPTPPTYQYPPLEPTIPPPPPVGAIPPPPPSPPPPPPPPQEIPNPGAG